MLHDAERRRRRRGAGWLSWVASFSTVLLTSNVARADGLFLQVEPLAGISRTSVLYSGGNDGKLPSKPLPEGHGWIVAPGLGLAGAVGWNLGPFALALHVADFSSTSVSVSGDHPSAARVRLLRIGPMVDVSAPIGLHVQLVVGYERDTVVDTTGIALALGLGWDFRLSDQLRLGPLLRIDWVNVSPDGATDECCPNQLSMSVLTTTLGASLSYR